MCIELSSEIRFLINVAEFSVSTASFIGFICGIISQDHDLGHSISTVS